MIVQINRGVKYMIQMGTKVKIKSSGEEGVVGALLGSKYIITIGNNVKRIDKNDLEEI